MTWHVYTVYAIVACCPHEAVVGVSYLQFYLAHFGFLLRGDFFPFQNVNFKDLRVLTSSPNSLMRCCSRYKAQGFQVSGEKLIMISYAKFFFSCSTVQ